MNNDSNRSFQALLIYTSLLLDNVLLTVIVPILPDYLSQLNNVNISIYNIPNSLIYKNYDLHYVPVILGKHPLTGSSLINFTITNNNYNPKERYEDYSDLNNFNNNNNNNENDRKRIILDDENSSIGILLAAKAITQLFITPIIGNLTLHVGYRLPIIFGTFCLLVTSLVFAIGASYISLLIARSLQGVASACIGVCGMSLVAQLYPEEDKRSKVMGIVLGSIALGVLLGYPIGGILYDFVGKSAPFYITSILILINLITQLYTMDYKHTRTEIITGESKYCTLLSDGMILKISIAICISTTAMAILEPCLPIWLIENLSPKKWQIGTVFIPDSIGYFIGTNFFGSIAYKFGQIKISIISMFIVGVSCFLIPNATSILSLLFPHFSLGLGIGILDAALIPLLASLVDSKYNNDDQSSASTDSMSSYGTVYSIQQISVSIAYSLGPIFGGEIAQYVGFRWLMTLIGLINIFYGFFLFIYYILFPVKDVLLINNNNNNTNTNNDINLTESKINFKNDYKRFYDTMDIP